MKNLVRAFTFALVAAGALASAHTSPATAQATMTARASALPIPTCPPDDPTGCGVCKLKGNCAPGGPSVR